MVHYAKLIAMGVLGVALGAGLMGLVVPANAQGAKSVEQLWRETETFEYLHALN
jgi:hypothetical protein